MQLGNLIQRELDYFENSNTKKISPAEPVHLQIPEPKDKNKSKR